MGIRTSVATTGADRVIRVGESALTGWRGRLGGAVARPIARRTRFSEQQVRAFLGFALLAYAAYRLLRPTIRAARSQG